MLKKINLTFIIIFLFQNINYAQAIKAGVKYNEANARIEVFQDIERKINKDIFIKYRKDKNKDLHISLIKSNIFEIKNERTICPFYIKNTLASYALTYENEPNYTFYYNILGNLIKFDIIQNEDYPRKILGYSQYGNLISAGLEIDENEQFIYDENGKLIAHWLDNEVLNKNNKIPKFIKLKRGYNP